MCVCVYCTQGKGEMTTYWLLGHNDMSEANESMVCKFKPRKKKKKSDNKQTTKKDVKPELIEETTISGITSTHSNADDNRVEIF